MKNKRILTTSVLLVTLGTLVTHELPVKQVDKPVYNSQPVDFTGVQKKKVRKNNTKHK